MTESTAVSSLLDAPLDRTPDAAPMQRQLYRRFKDAILHGRLAPGDRMPGSRALAESLAISRNTVTAAYDLLAAEGYVQPDRQGTRVAALSFPKPPRATSTPLAAPSLSQRVSRVQQHWRSSDSGLALRPGVPALTHFPLNAWRRTVDRATLRGGHAALGYGDH